MPVEGLPIVRSESGQRVHRSAILLVRGKPALAVPLEQIPNPLGLAAHLVQPRPDLAEPIDVRFSLTERNVGLLGDDVDPVADLGPVRQPRVHELVEVAIGLTGLSERAESLCPDERLILAKVPRDPADLGREPGGLIPPPGGPD